MPQNKKGVASCIKIILHIWSMKVVVQILTNVVSYQCISEGYSKGFERRQMKLEFNMFPILNDTCMPMDLSKG